ncbi:class I SAM-dependent methyltransferase [Roseibium sp. CAU 1637]|uniref:Class I SAM-dependent methyltransferase n=1 Tax=Roseibium limicola TaxID=2816037 RepID=A0A939EPA1_9HYPH|nr:class I SAM-dependent methyltransferase [Roseibium limicola]MBO0346184.1 class I SAM-dependent methyltransferase [Roseibium limicola]
MDDTEVGSATFLARRDAARRRLDDLTGGKGGTELDRKDWFKTVYREADGDPAAVPWADMKPKQALLAWLENNPGNGEKALDVACGLGDNAEAMAKAGYSTTAFDLAGDAIDWARQRFPQTAVDYQVADLLQMPEDWNGAFDLVHECYTLQALQEPLRSNALKALAGLVKPGGQLLLITRCRPEGVAVDGPPWPLAPSEWKTFESLGFTLMEAHEYEIARKDRSIPHVRALFHKTG